MKPELITALLLTTMLAHGQDAFIYDQQATNIIEGSGFLNYQGQTIGQSFTPSFSAVGFVALNLYDAGSLPIGATVYVNIRSDSFSGPILGSSMPVTMPNQFFGITNFLFSTPLVVTPSVTYFFEPVVQSGDGWGSYVTDGSYPGGTAISQGVPIPDRDLWFREGVVVPEPSSVGLILLGAGVLGLARWRRGRGRRSSL